MALTDLTRISTSGIATGTSLSGAILHGDAHFRGTQVGVTSALFDSSDDALEFNDNVKLKFGNSGDLALYHTGSHSYIQENGSGNLILDTNGFSIKLTYDDSETMLRAIRNKQVELYYDDGKKFETAETGAIVTGILTATGFSGPTNNTSGIATFYDLRVSNNLTVEGTTTTLDTNLIGVDRVEVGANSNTVTGIAVTQSGTADIVRLYDGASQVVTVDDEGNVGVGINSPSTKLQVHGGLVKISGHAYARVTVNDGANEAFFGFENQGPLLIGNANADAQIRVQGTNDIFFQTGNTVKRLTIKGDTGNVGIGSEIPNEKLDVVGVSSFTGDVFFKGAITSPSPRDIFWDYSASELRLNDNANIYAGNNRDAFFGHDGSSTRLQDTYGHFFIGGNLIQIKSGNLSEEYIRMDNTSKEVKLFYNSQQKMNTIGTGVSVTGALTVEGSPAEVRIQHAGNSSYSRLISNSSNELKIYTGGGPHLGMTIDGSQRVGIGTDDPQEKLHVHQDTGTATVLISSPTAPQIRINPNAADGSDNDRTLFGQATANSHFVSSAVAGDTILRGTSSGRLLFGVGTSEKLRIAPDGVITAQKSAVFGNTSDSFTSVTITSSTSGVSELRFADTTANAGYIKYEHSSNNELILATNATPRLSITSAGEVVIASNGILTIKPNPAATYGVQEALRIDNGGSYGDRALQIFEYQHSGGRYHRIQFNTHTTTDGSAYTHTQGAYGGSSAIEFEGNGELVFFTNPSAGSGSTSTITPSERLRIANDGNIGVAGVTGTDFSLLDGMVINTGNGSAGLLINSSSSSHNAYLGFSYGSGSSTSHADQYSAYIGRVGDDTLILGAGNNIKVQIGTDGEVKCVGADDNKGFAVYTSATKKVAELIEHSADGELRLYTGEATPVLRSVITSYGYSYINANGTNRFGIGTNNPIAFTHIKSNSEHQLYVESIDGGAGGSMKVYSPTYAYYCSQNTSREWRWGNYGGASYIMRDNTATANVYEIDTGGRIKLPASSFYGTRAANSITSGIGVASGDLMYIRGSAATTNSAFDMFTIGNLGGNQMVHIEIYFHHSGGGRHGSYLRGIYGINSYTDIDTIESHTHDHGGGGGFTISRPATGDFRVRYNGSSSFHQNFQLMARVWAGRNTPRNNMTLTDSSGGTGSFSCTALLNF